MLFSIVVPVYNVEKYLEDCLESIICQIDDEKDYEVILVDDGSMDKSGIICDEYQRKYPNLIRVYHNTNHGLLLTRRYGYKYATGEYIINCDSDDQLEPSIFESIRRIINKYDFPDVILFDYYRFTENTKEKEYENVFTHDSDCQVTKERVLNEFMLRHSVVSMCGKACRRTCIDVKKDYTVFAKVSNGEDTLQSIEIFNNANTFVYLNRALYDYRMGSGMTGKFDLNYYCGFKKVFENVKLQKDVWSLSGFDKLFAVKVLQTAGRAITQSRYNCWESTKQQKEFLKKIAEDDMLQQCMHYFKEVKEMLQKNHVLLLELLSLKMYRLIIIMLELKNKMELEKIDNES